MENNTHTVQSQIGLHGLQTLNTNALHQFYSDLPEEKNGTNSGMNPKEIILSGLGSCTCITLKVYAASKNIPLIGVNVTLSLSDPINPAQATFIDRKIELLGDLTEEQKDKLLQVAIKCPVAKLLSGEIKIESEILKK
ncbi:MAG: OsmC family peroxiredoxin [Pedobacter sp.]|nr:MAG: OsmC family peroxiredoxin [Pedobacter sp.]